MSMEFLAPIHGSSYGDRVPSPRSDQVITDADLARIYEFTELVAASSRSPRQRERLATAVQTPLPGASLQVLRSLDRHGPMAISDLAKRLGVDQSTASRQVRPLEEHALVTRTGDPADRRVSLLACSRVGRELIERIRSVALNDFRVALASWSPHDREQLVELLDRFRQSLLHTTTDSSGWSVSVEGDLSPS
jgi:DNA-binding MarR family transcriptional regulator